MLAEAYIRLRDIVAERTNPIVFWIGAGLSRPSGLPSWRDLRDALRKAALARANALEAEEKREVRELVTSADAQKDLWIAFDILKKAVGPTTYRNVIRDKLSAMPRCEIPADYKRLWQLPVKGAITLNLDSFVLQSYSEVRSGERVVPFTGIEAGTYTHVLKQAAPFIVNLHGRIDNESSWILTESELRKLLRNKGYTEFIRTVLCAFTVVFVGITADDKAVAAHFNWLSNKGIDFGDHYWLTDRTDTAADTWAEKAGVRLIRYQCRGADHSELSSLLAQLSSYVSMDSKPAPAAPSQRRKGLPHLPSPEAILRENPDEIRYILNEHAARILAPRNKEAHEAYAEFCREYDRAIYQSWYVNISPPDNVLLGYTIASEIKQGAFGRVFEAYDEDGARVAIKLLREDIRRDDNMLQSFRRGVQSMGILSRREVSGMVPYRETSEIPAFAVMEFVEGVDLTDAVQSGNLSNWGTTVRVALDLARILRKAHRLPERVLHRNIRPSNVMLRDFYGLTNAFEVVVLDFDLSWYRGAVGVSINDANTVTGYLAPEQVRSGPTSSTRNALVDSFGLGMTLYYMRTGKDPNHLQHLHAEWESDCMSSICVVGCDSWKSLPRRFARLILSCTQDSQSMRWDMAQIQGELERLTEVLRDPSQVPSADLWAEEIAARAVQALGTGYDYTWDPDLSTSRVKLPRGLALSFRGSEEDHEVKLSLQWVGTGDAKYENLKKYLPAHCDRAADALKKGGWRLQKKPDVHTDLVTFEARMSVSLLRTEYEKAADAAAHALEEMRLE